MAGTALKVIVTATTAKAAGAASLRRVPCKAKWAPWKRWDSRLKPRCTRLREEMVAYHAAKAAKLAPFRPQIGPSPQLSVGLSGATN